MPARPEPSLTRSAQLPLPHVLGQGRDLLPGRIRPRGCGAPRKVADRAGLPPALAPALPKGAGRAGGDGALRRSGRASRPAAGGAADRAPGRAVQPGCEEADRLREGRRPASPDHRHRHPRHRHPRPPGTHLPSTTVFSTARQRAALLPALTCRPAVTPSAQEGGEPLTSGPWTRHARSACDGSCAGRPDKPGRDAASAEPVDPQTNRGRRQPECGD